MTPQTDWFLLQADQGPLQADQGPINSNEGPLRSTEEPHRYAREPYIIIFGNCKTIAVKLMSSCEGERGGIGDDFPPMLSVGDGSFTNQKHW